MCHSQSRNNVSSHNAFMVSRKEIGIMFLNNTNETKRISQNYKNIVFSLKMTLPNTTLLVKMVYLKFVLILMQRKLI